MKKLLIAALAMLLTASASFAQQLDIEWGKSFDSKTEVISVLGFAGNKMVTYSIKGKKMYLSTHDDDSFAELSSGELELPKLGGKEAGLLDLVVTGETVTAVVYSFQKKTKSFELFTQEYDVSGRRKGSPKSIYKSAASNEKLKNMRVTPMASPDNSKLMIYFDRMNKERTEFYSDVIVLDTQDEIYEVSNNSFEFKVRDGRSEKVQYNVRHDIENDGSFSMIRTKVELTKGKIADYGLSVARYDNSGDLIGEFEVKQDDILLSAPTLVVQGDKTYMVAYYMNNVRNRGTVYGYSGIYSAEFNSRMNLVEEKTNDFSPEFMKNLYTERRVERMKSKGKELLVPASYRMQDLFVHSDGSMTILSELYHVSIEENRGVRTITTTYGSILYYKLDADGNLFASDAIHKVQTSAVSQPVIGIGIGGVAIFTTINTKDKLKKYWSYACMQKDDRVYILFNDHFKNSADGQDELSKPMRNPKKSVPFIVTITPDGDFSKDSMVGSADNETYTVPQVTYGLSEDEFIIWGVWKKENKFGIAKID